MTSRYVYFPATAKRVGRRLSLLARIRRKLRRRNVPDMFPIVDYYPPVYPTKK